MPFLRRFPQWLDRVSLNVPLRARIIAVEDRDGGSCLELCFLPWLGWLGRHLIKELSGEPLQKTTRLDLQESLETAGGCCPTRPCLIPAGAEQRISRLARGSYAASSNSKLA